MSNASVIVKACPDATSTVMRRIDMNMLNTLCPCPSRHPYITPKATPDRTARITSTPLPALMLPGPNASFPPVVPICVAALPPVPVLVPAGEAIGGESGPGATDGVPDNDSVFVEDTVVSETPDEVEDDEVDDDEDVPDDKVVEGDEDDEGGEDEDEEVIEDEDELVGVEVRLGVLVGSPARLDPPAVWPCCPGTCAPEIICVVSLSVSGPVC